MHFSSPLFGSFFILYYLSEFGKQQTQKCECLLGDSLCVSHRQMVVKTFKVKSSPCYKNSVSLSILYLSECHYNAKDTWVRNLELHCASFSFFFHHGFLLLLPKQLMNNYQFSQEIMFFQFKPCFQSPKQFITAYKMNSNFIAKFIIQILPTTEILYVDIPLSQHQIYHQLNQVKFCTTNSKESTPRKTVSLTSKRMITNQKMNACTCFQTKSGIIEKDP